MNTETSRDSWRAEVKLFIATILIMTVLFTSKKRSFGLSRLFNRKTKSFKSREGIDYVTVSPLIKLAYWCYYLLPAQESQAHVTSV